MEHVIFSLLNNNFENVIMYYVIISPGRYPYFDVVVELAWSNDLESHAGSSAATGRASHAGQIKGDDPDEKRYPGPSGCELGLGLTTHTVKYIMCLLRNF
jgi:hypothetical protein